MAGAAGGPDLAGLITTGGARNWTGSDHPAPARSSSSASKRSRATGAARARAGGLLAATAIRGSRFYKVRACCWVWSLVWATVRSHSSSRWAWRHSSASRSPRGVCSRAVALCGCRNDGAATRTPSGRAWLRRFLGPEGSADSVAEAQRQELRVTCSSLTLLSLARHLGAGAYRPIRRPGLGMRSPASDPHRPPWLCFEMARFGPSLKSGLVPEGWTCV